VGPATLDLGPLAGTVDRPASASPIAKRKMDKAVVCKLNPVFYFENMKMN